jgi:hydrogenase nickel incorporation protein HypB
MVEIKVLSDILKANDAIAEQNRKKFRDSNVVVFNLIGSPGAGKTSVIEVAIQRLEGAYRIGVIEGDIATSRDAERVGKLGVETLQINTRGACHLDANMVATALVEFPYQGLDLLFIENVGNLVCPAGYALGEDAKIVVISVPEGEDKPAKYPLIFRNASLMLLNKMDFQPYCDLDIEAMKKDALGVNPALDVIGISCTTGGGAEEWAAWLTTKLQQRHSRE